MGFLLEGQNIVWLAIAVVSGGLLIWPMVNRGGSTAIGTLAATQLINRERAAVIDVSSAEEFAAGHVAGAKSLPLADIKEGAAALPKNKALPIVVVCATGARSARGAAELKKLGYDNAQVLQGGLRAWREAGLPTEKSDAGTKPAVA